jgi:TRAP-type C4-dicarboxylate transport system substrate-binding protein
MCTLFALVGCSASTSTPSKVRVLSLAHIDGDSSGDPAIDWFTSEVAKVSNGKLQIKTKWECCGDATSTETNLVSGVKSGKFDLGWVGTRVFADLGIHSAEALTAPMMIDSYALEGAVVQSAAGKDALAGLTGAGITPLALEPGLLRRPIVSRAPLIALGDWQGITFDVFPSKASATAIQALGAKPVQLGFAQRDDGIANGSIRGLENSIVFEENEKSVASPFITTNVVLWPRISALIANPKVLRGLTNEQREWLREASSAVEKRTPDLAKADTAAVAALCQGAGRFAELTPDQLAEVRGAFATVYSQIGADKASAKLIDALGVMKKSAGEDAPFSYSKGCLS